MPKPKAAAASVPLIQIHGIAEPRSLAARERRPVPGLESMYEVTRTGRVWSAQKKDFMVDGYEVILTIGGKHLYAKTSYLAALAWLTKEERDEIRSELARTPRDLPKDDKGLEAVAAKYRISKYAADFVARMPEEDFRPIVVDEGSKSQILPEPARP